MSAAAYDFVHPDPFPVEAKGKLQGWLGDFAAAVARRWSAQLPFELQFEAQDHSTGPAAELTRSSGPGAVGVQVQVHAGPTGIAYSEIPIVAALVAGMLGDTVEQLPEGTELTPIETALFEVLCHEFLEALFETWPSKQTPKLRLGSAQPGTELRRVFAPFDPVIDLSWKVTIPCGDGLWHWIMPLRWVVDVIVRHEPPAPSTLRHPDIGAIPLEIRVWLGETELSVAELRGLRRGDVLLLDTAVDGELALDVNDRRLFTTRPVRVGSRQAVQIVERVDE